MNNSNNENDVGKGSKAAKGEGLFCCCCCMVTEFDLV